ncbi:MAG: hypothetical protein GWP39_10995 [Planctomycetia bacterium]|nr:hypothetical protein [Planctomycetia bacterium]
MRGLKLLVIILGSIALLVGVLVTSLPALIGSALVLGGDAAIGSGKTDVGKVSMRVFSGEAAIEGLKLRNPDLYPTEEFFKLESIELELPPAQLLSKPVRIEEVNIRGLELTVDTVVDDEGFHLNLLDLRNRMKELLPTKEEATEKTDGTKKGPPVVIELLKVRDLQLLGQLSLPGGFSQPVSLSMPDFELAGIGEKENGVVVAEVFQIVIDALIAAAITAIDENSEEWGLGDQETAGLKLLLSGGDVGEAVEQQLRDRINEELKKRLPGGLKGLLPGQKDR